MSSRLILADSSVWVSHLTGQRSAVSDTMSQLLRTHRVAINDVVRMEVLTGALNDAQYAGLADMFQGLHILPMTDPVWRRAERLRFELRQKGHVIPLPDVLIASSALLHDCELFHTDKHFDVIARATALQIHHFAHH